MTKITKLTIDLAAKEEKYEEVEEKPILPDNKIIFTPKQSLLDLLDDTEVKDKIKTIKVI